MDIITLFTKGNGEYKRTLKFDAIALSVVIIIIFTTLFAKNYGFVIILLLFVYYIANTYVIVKTGYLEDRNAQTMIKLQKIQDTINSLVMERIRIMTNSNQKLSKLEKQKMLEANRVKNLYMDSDMIHFIYAIIPFSEYNGQEFLLFMRGVDNILETKRLMEEFYESNDTFPENTSEMFEIAIQLKSNTINNLHNYVYSVPKQKDMMAYLDKIVEKYNILISRNLDTMHKYYLMNLSKRGIKNTTKFVSYNEARPFDEMSNHSLVPNKRSGKLINHYY